MLNYIDTLVPGIRSTAAAVASATGAPVSVSLFASWQKVQGYNVHFDTQNVFALQVVGRKTWRIYANREVNPARIPGFDSASVPPDEAEKRKGPLLLEVTLEPGDLLYVPPGFYHQALAESDASVHVGYGACHFVIQDFLNLLVRDLPKIPAFRAPLAHFDEPEALARQLAEVAEQLRAIVAQPQQAETMRGFLRAKAFEQYAVFDLPQRRPNQRFRLRRTAKAPDAGTGTLAADLAAWAGRAELFALSDLRAAFAERPEAELEAALQDLIRRGLVEPV
ncbi:MAG: cupin domain-containing protein [Tistlia sp.]